MNKNILFTTHRISFLLNNKRLIRQWIEETIAEEGKDLDSITYIFCDDNYLLKMNKKYLNADYLTDVITFDYSDHLLLSGDILISLDRVKENARTYKTTRQNELFRVMIHGVLHLCGYKDKTKNEKTKMKEKEDYYLNKIELMLLNMS